MSDLLPCPFCGGNRLSEGCNEYGGLCTICDGCNAMGPASEPDFAEVVAAWNRRADLPRPQDAARIAELEAENARLMSDLAAKGPWPKPPDGARCSPPSYEMDPFSVKYVFGSGWTLFKSRRECGSKCTVRGYDSAESALAAMVHVRAALAADSGAAE